jgi:hypothetical protein
MMNVECPWCAEPATVEAGEAGEFSCAGCAIRVELAPEPISEPVARAA